MHRNRLLHPDPRVGQALSLLREALDGGAAEPRARSGRESSAADPLAPLGPDFLGAEFRPLWQSLPGDEPWPVAGPGDADGAAADPDAALPASSYRHWQPPSDFHAGEGLAAFQRPFWTRPGRPDDALRAEDALAVADCLYDFLHALGRFDVEAAMACVADDFHALQAHRELDRQGLRHGLEELLDGLQGREIDVSLAEMPRPVAYGRLALCEATLQIDPAATPPDVPRSLVLRRLLAFERDGRGGWRILAAGHLDEAGDHV